MVMVTRRPWLGLSICLSLLIFTLPGETWAGSPSQPTCPGRLPDGADVGDCCDQITLNLPAFPAIDTGQKDDLFICWQDCEAEEPNGIPVDACWSAPISVKTDLSNQFPSGNKTPVPGEGNNVCGYFQAYVDLNVCPTVGPSVRFANHLGLIYSRTWIETRTFDLELIKSQVWRFLVNGDLIVDSEETPCPVPPCAATHGDRVRFTGYIDYIRDVEGGDPNGGFLYSWALNHECDVMDHASGSGRSGTFHSDRSYTFVSPGTGFVIDSSPMTNPPETGTIVAEALRPYDLTAIETGNICLVEEPIEEQQDEIDPPEEFCQCDSGTTLQHAKFQFSIDSTCGTQLTTDPNTCPNGFVSKGIGRWTAPGTYPGQERLRINFASYIHDPFCDTRATRTETFFGVTTLDGWATFTLTGTGAGTTTAIPSTFIDQGNSLRFPQQTPTKNIRYWSDLIVNLNLDP